MCILNLIENIPPIIYQLKLKTKGNTNVYSCHTYSVIQYSIYFYKYQANKTDFNDKSIILLKQITV